MSQVTVEALRVAFGHTVVLDGIDLEVPAGSLVAVLGPSGCGKTTMLRAIAGLLPVADGTIRVGDRVLSSTTRRVPPEKRGMGWVPQDASLFPHLTVGENIGFGIPRHGRAPRVAELAAMVGLADFTDRMPANLSGGQAQRVSLARALAPRPELVLLDEPFSALDPQLRSSLRNEVVGLLRANGNTSLLVTHDQEEALSLADYVAVMRDGRILQWGTPADIYEHPTSAWVAGFVGDVVDVEGIWTEGRVSSVFGLLEADLGERAHPLDGDVVHAMLRPEWLELGGDGAPASVIDLAYAGHDALVTLRLECGTTVRARVPAPDLPRPGDEVMVRVRRRALVYPTEEGTAATQQGSRDTQPDALTARPILRDPARVGRPS